MSTNDFVGWCIVSIFLCLILLSCLKRTTIVEEVPQPDNYCPECGAGPNLDGSYRLPRGYPFDIECSSCRERSLEIFRKLGRKMAEEQDRRFWDIINKP